MFYSSDYINRMNGEYSKIGCQVFAWSFEDRT